MTLMNTTVSSLTTGFSCITAVINFRLLYSIFLSQKLKKFSSLSLFYVRFGIDGFIGFINIINMFFTMLKVLEPEVDLDPYQKGIFYIAWPWANMIPVRALLITVIAIDRALAVFAPIGYHHYRSKVSNWIVIFLVCCWPIVNNIVLWVVCKFNYEFLPGCVSFGCLANSCYTKYSLSLELLAHCTVALICLALAIKLYIWRRFTNGAASKDLERSIHALIALLLVILVVKLTLFNKSQDGSKNIRLEKANKLVLIDAAMILVFDVIPAVLLVNYTWLLGTCGPLFSHSKMVGFAIEGCIVYRELRRNRTVRPKNSNGMNDHDG
ncbi:hypothetical protein CAEBREN_14995 [Caenorhabditis brenneri]|uniref:G-protein coupled receptors family 1 profile domain-containing protein n=1 Tax=Caenorhabditis brenneri TaxID=135651 RepID=G0NEH7_CAEBE|nr:hypothetical protein CAEBREN_14995 [Caenorhabditis brenneri]